MDFDVPDPEQELELLSPEILQDRIVWILELYVKALGESLPLGHSWEELAQEMHRGSNDKEFLLTLIKE